MLENENKIFQDPANTLQEAIEELNHFTQEASRLEVNEEGRLVSASDKTSLKRIINLARSFITPLFSRSLRREQEKKLGEIKQALLKARDTIQTHFPLILEFKEGDENQQKLAQYALTTIQRYNTVVALEEQRFAKYEIYNYERQRLLQDREIKGLQIELPRSYSLKFDSESSFNPAKKILNDLSAAFLEKKGLSINSPKYKKNNQFLVDTFRLKSLRLIQDYFSQKNPTGEIVKIVKETPLEIDEETHSDRIGMEQLLEVGPGFFILVSGSFMRSNERQFLSLPLLDKLKLSVQLNHSGYPYPSQRGGWTLGDSWIEVLPLRGDQVSVFQKINQRKKLLSQKLLTDQNFIQQARKRALAKKQIFDNHRDSFLPLYKSLQNTLNPMLHADDFFQQAKEAYSSYDFIVQGQQHVQNLFFKKPFRVLEEEWLKADSILRTGTSVQKYSEASKKIQEVFISNGQLLNETNPVQAFILQQGKELGSQFQSILLQYLSEKIHFSPPLLKDSVRKLQICAFQHLIDFMDECEQRIDILDEEKIKDEMIQYWEQDIQYFTNTDEKRSLPQQIVDQLEVYFNSRYYSLALHNKEN